MNIFETIAKYLTMMYAETRKATQNMTKQLEQAKELLINPTKDIKPFKRNK